MGKALFVRREFLKELFGMVREPRECSLEIEKFLIKRLLEIDDECLI